jgi:hypothetical protein
MKGIIVTKKQFDAVSSPIKNRLIIEKKGNEYALIDPYDDKDHILGEAISEITGIKKIPLLRENGTAGWTYPKWNGKTIDSNKQEA